MVEARQTLLTRRFFDREAAGWSAEYRTGGHMSDRVERFFSAIGRHGLAPGRALDVGCGSGEIALALAEAGWRVTACDLAPRMIETARARAPQLGIDWRVLEAGAGLPFPDDGYELVLSSSVLEYVEDLPKHFAEIARILRPEGRYFTTIPDMRHALRQKEEQQRRRLGNPLFLGLMRLSPWRSTSEYLRLSVNRFDFSEWEKLLSAAGLEARFPDECTHPLALIEARRRVAGA